MAFLRSGEVHSHQSHVEAGKTKLNFIHSPWLRRSVLGQATWLCRGKPKSALGKPKKNQHFIPGPISTSNEHPDINSALKINVKKKARVDLTVYK